MGASTLVLLAVLSAAPMKVAAPEWSTVNLSRELSVFFADEVARVMRREGIDVVTARDIATLIGLERQKQLLGCTEASESCMTELGAALGCDYVLVGNLARLDETYRGSLRVVSSRDGKTLADEAVEATGQKALADALEQAAVRLAQRLRPAAPPTPVRSYAWIPLASGALLAAGAATTFTLAGNDAARISSSDEQTALRLAQDGRTLQTSGWALAGVAAAALVGAAVMFAFGGGSSVAPIVSVTPTGAGVGVSGALP